MVKLTSIFEGLYIPGTSKQCWTFGTVPSSLAGLARKDGEAGGCIY
jgi:hypothetical protein